MPMIDVYAPTGTFPDRSAVAQQAAAVVMRWEAVPELDLFRDNTAGFVHDLDPGSASTVSGSASVVRVQVLTPVGVLDRAKQVGVVADLTSLVREHASAPVEHVWVLIVESPDGGWGIDGQACTGADIAAAARAEIAARAAKA